MADIKSLFWREKRDPLSIIAWLRSQGFGDSVIKLSMAEHAQRIIDGEQFGYVNGISVLSNSIRNRCKELTLLDAQKVIASFGRFSKTDGPIKKVWKFLNKPLGKKHVN